jgi:hypothetical protein
MTTVTIEIKEDGTSSIKVNGVKGKSCKAVTAPFESCYDDVKSKETPDYYVEGPQRVAIGTK